MKKTKLISLLLATLMTTSSLPMAVPIAASEAPSATIEIGENLLDGVTPEFSTAAVSMDAADAGNGFLQVKRADTWGNGDTRWRGLAYSFNTAFEAEKTYFLSFRMRTTTKPVNTSNDDSAIAVDGKNYTRLRINGNVSHSPSGTATTAWSVKSAGEGNKLLFNKNGMDEIWVNEEWNTYVISLENVASATANGFIYFCGGTGDFPESFEIDDFKLYSTDDNKYDSTLSYFDADCYDFSTEPTVKVDTSSVKGAFQPIWQNNFGSNSKPDVIYVKRSCGYDRIPANIGKDTYVTYDMDEIVLTPGTYKLDAELRRGDWLMGGVVNKSKVTASVTFADSNQNISFDTTVYTSWVNVSKKIDITEPTALSAISFKTVGEKNALDFGKVTFKLVSPVYGTETDLGTSMILETTDLLNGVAVTFGDGAIMNTPVNSGDGYLTLAPRVEASVMSLFPINFNVIPDGETTYYVSFDIRSSVLLGNTSSRTTTDLFRFRVLSNIDNTERVSAGYSEKYIVPTENSTAVMDKDTNGNNRYGHVPLNGEWAYFEGKFTPAASSSALQILINRGTQDERAPFDIDNFKLWTDEGTVYAEDFNDSEKAYVGKSTDYNKFYPGADIAKLVPDVQDEFIRVTPDEETPPSVKYDFTEIDAEYLDGIYFFDAELRAGKYLFDNYPYQGTNDGHEVAVTFGLKDIDDTDGVIDKTETVTGDISVMWEEMQFPMTVPTGYELTDITVTTNYTGIPLDIKNVKLTSDQFPIIEEDDADTKVNYLDGVTIRTENTAPVTVINDETSYLSVGERALSDSTNFLVIKLNTEIKANEKYYVSMKIRGTEGASTMIRPKFDLDSKDQTLIVKEALHKDLGGNLEIDGFDTTAGMNAEYIVPTKATVDAGVSGWVASAADSGAHKRVIPLTHVTSEWQTFEGYFTPIEDVSASRSQIVIQRGNDSKHIQPFDIDDIVVWTENNGQKNVVFEKHFEDKTELKDIAAKAKLTQIVPVNDYLYLAPFDSSKEMTVIYDINIDESQLVEGRYFFRTLIRTETDTEATAIITFLYEDGTTDTESVSFGKDWTVISISRELGAKTKLCGLKLTVDSDFPIMLRLPALNIRYKWEYGKPNYGIVMILMKKFKGEMMAPKRVEFLPDGDFEAMPPVIYNSAIAKTQTAADEGFWAKQAPQQSTTLSVETEDGNTFVRVTNLDTSARGIWYNTGVTLDPGEYVFSVDLRVSETSASKHYEAYTWHNSAKDWQFMRTILQDPNQMSLGHYALYDPVDKRTAMNDTGYVTGYQSKVTRDWTTYTDTIVIEKPTVIIFKIGGGTSGQPDSHGFDIDNVSLKGYVSADESQG